MSIAYDPYNIFIQNLLIETSQKYFEDQCHDSQLILVCNVLQG